MLPLYPEIKPYARHQLKVDDTHEIYLDESGNVDGIPVLFVHSGPGSGCEFDSRSFFSPEKYRIILFDQRGCGRSTPHCELKNNTTADLVSDMEQIRDYLGIEKWLLFGGGWGSTLSLVYAETHPDRVLAMVLRGIFLGRELDVQWFYQHGANRFLPDYWEDYQDHITPGEQHNFVEAYRKRMTGSDELARMWAAKAWSSWEAHAATLHPNQRLIKHFGDTHRALARCQVGTHYFANNCFLEDNQILNNADAIQDIPGIIVHGRFDLISPMDNAYDLHRQWPDSQLFIIREAGHSATEPTIIDALIRATRDMTTRFEDDFSV